MMQTKKQSLPKRRLGDDYPMLPEVPCDGGFESYLAPIIGGGSIPAIAEVCLYALTGRNDLTVLGQRVRMALQEAGLAVEISDGSMTIAGRYKAPLPEYRMDRTIYYDLVQMMGYELGDTIPVSVRKIFPGGQHGGSQTGLYIYSGLYTNRFPTDEPLFVVKGDQGSDELIPKLKRFAVQHASTPLDFDLLAQALTAPEYPSQRWPVMPCPSYFVGMSRLCAPPGEPDVYYFPDSAVAVSVKDGNFQHVPIPNADGKTRHVMTWKQLSSYQYEAQI